MSGLAPRAGGEPRRRARVLACVPPWIALLALAGALAPRPPGTPGPAAPSQASPAPEGDALTRSFAEHGLLVDLEHGLLALEVRVLIRDELLEYLLVNAKGAAHESLFVTDVQPSLLNTALLTLGVEKGENARWVERVPPPSEDELRAGVSPYEVTPPRGDGFFLYALWYEGEDLFVHRVEDLVRDLSSGRTMRRHPWVFLGSRMVRPRVAAGAEPAAEQFVADLEGNLVSVVLFSQGNVLVTAALPESLRQTIWLPNAWLLPAEESPVLLCFARERLDVLPPSLLAAAPRLPAREEVPPAPRARPGEAEEGAPAEEEEGSGADAPREER